MGWWRFAGASRIKRNSDVGLLLSRATLHPHPLLTEAELFFYNLLCLAVQDRYLVFAHVPLWSVIHIEAPRSARAELLQRIALKRLDFALVHPGSRMVEHVVQLEEDQVSDVQVKERLETIKMVMNAAEIRFTTVPPNSSYTISELATLLGLGDPE